MTVSRKMPGGVPAADDADKFIAGAARKTTLPWQGHPPADVDVQLNTRVTWRVMQQLDWLSHTTGVTKRDIVDEALQAHFRKAGVPR